VIGGATIIEVVTLPRIALPIIFAALAGQSTELQTLPSAKRWSVALPARAVASPTIAGDVVVVGLQSGHVAAYSAKQGTEVWRVQLRADQAIVADETLLFIAAGDMIHALDAADGRVLWAAPSGTLTAPLLVQGGWVIAATAGQLAAFREIDGAKVWSHDSASLHTRPTIEGDNLYVPLDEGRLLALNLANGTERWTRFPAKGHLSEVLALPERVIVGAANKYLYVYDADDGTIEWRPLIGAELRGRPATDGAHVFVASMDNLVRAFDRRSGALVWKAPLPYRPVGPVVAASTLIVPGAAAEIRAFELKTGKPAGQIKVEQPLVVPPVFQTSASGVLMAAITGSVSGEWTLLVLGPPAPQALLE
jgi:outer membrane protein assembly factor BamB